jgi:acetate kinase
MEVIDECLTGAEAGVVADLGEIEAVGHRVVHGLDQFVSSVVINQSVIDTIEHYQYLAPLHNPPNLSGIRAARDLIPEAVHVAVFDTAFHQTMPEHAFLYAVPYELYEKHKIRKYGFHGTNHRYCAVKAAEMLGKPAEKFAGVTCHLGNGCSLAAIKNGKSIDTTMGLTPLEGVPMGTRSGDVDPALVFMLGRQFDMSLDEIDNLLNKKSGFLGLSGISNDLRPVQEAMANGNRRARLAIEVFAYRVKKYIGAYHAAIGPLDAIVFTGGIGECSAVCREAICRDSAHLGITIDPARNESVVATLAEIQTPESPVKILVIPANEELMIARDTHRLVQSGDR